MWGDMAQLYKSHWAYYLLIHKIVLGERIKMSRRNLIPYHVPIWQIMNLLDDRKCCDLDNHRFIIEENDSLMHYIHKTLSELIKTNNAIEMKYPLPRFPQYQCHYLEKAYKMYNIFLETSKFAIRFSFSREKVICT